MRNWIFVRRLYEPRFQDAMVWLLLALLAGYYLVWSTDQWLNLDPAKLRFDFVNYFGGAQAAAQGTDIYAEFKRSWGTQAWTVAYIYPPLFALLLAPLTGLGLVAAARVWLLVVHAALLGSLWLIIRANPELSPRLRRLFLVLALGFMPVYLNLKFQQVASLWLLTLTVALWAASRKHDRAAGLLTALGASLKVVPVFILPLFARLGRWYAAAWGVLALVLVNVAAMLLAPGSWQFFTVVLPRISLGNDNWDNGSIDGLVSRFVAFFPTALGPHTASFGKAAVVIAGAAVLGVTLWRAGAGVPESWRLRLGMAALVTALLLVSSVTWQHHLVVLLLPLGVALAWLTARRASPGYWLWLFAGYACCWLDRRAFPLPASGSVHSAGQALLVLAGTSVKMVGLILLWTLLLEMLRTERRMTLRLPGPGQASALPPAA